MTNPPTTTTEPSTEARRHGPDPSRTAMIQVLGAVAYGEYKAYEEAKQAEAAATDPDERASWRRVAAQELRHHKGFVGRLEAMGADAERAMRPYRKLLDRYHGQEPGDPVEEAVWSYFGEGIAEDLLVWLQRVSDPQTAAFIDGVMADEEEHEGGATRRIQALVAASPRNRLRAARAVASMLRRLALSATPGPLPLSAFVRVGRTPELLGGITGGFVRRVHALGLSPIGLFAPRPATP